MIALGIVGQPHLAEVDQAGQLMLANGQAVRWWVAAEDCWHDPSSTRTVRQQSMHGTPVVETRVRVPGGDVVGRVYAVADRGGALVLEWENSSPASAAVAVVAPGLHAARPLLPANAVDAGIPASAVGIPVAHGSTARVAVSSTSDLDVRALPAADAVIAGWERHVATAGRYGTPDPSLWTRVVYERSQLSLRGPGAVADDPVEALCAMAELVRMGADPEPFVVSVADGCARLARHGGPGGASALAAASEVLTAAGEHRAVRDVERLADGISNQPFTESEQGARWLWWTRSQMVGGRSSSIVLAPAPFPPGWFGQSVEVLDERVGSHRVGWAVRWHGERPALLWEVEPGADSITCPGIDPAFVGSGARGEALLAAPAAASFS